LVVVEDNLLSRDPDGEAPRLAGVEGLQIEAFWHSAASVRFVETDTNEVWNTNVTGLKNALALADQLRIPIFNQVSTAYSCGTMSGRILETLEREPAGFNNIYEQSKHFGEQLVRSYCQSHRIEYRIIRPSIIIGHSQTFRASSTAGFYYCLDALKLLHDKTVARDRSYFDRNPLRLRIDRNATLNFIPIDFVVTEMIDLHRRGSDTLNEVFHLTSDSPVSMCDWLTKLAPTLGIKRIELAADDSELSALDRMFNKQVKVFLPYMTQRKMFDRSNIARHGIDGHQMDYLLDTERLRCFASHYLADPRTAEPIDRVA
jgi:nucleoside-diphosphate-sugar epimerase